MRSPALAKKVADLALSKKAKDVVIMDLRGLTAMTDFFVVCSGESDTQVKAIANAVEDGIEGKGPSPWHKETGSVNWILLDYVDVVLHVFHKNLRGFYNLEKLWGDAVIRKLDDVPKPEAAAPARPAKERRAGKTAQRQSKTARTSSRRKLAS